MFNRCQNNLSLKLLLSFPDSSADKESTCIMGDPGSIPGSGRAPEEGKGYQLQYSGLENSMDCIVHGVAKSDMTERLSLRTSLISKYQWMAKLLQIFL